MSGSVGAESGDRRGLRWCAQITAIQRFGALDRRLRARFARAECKLSLLKTNKSAILVAKLWEYGEYRLLRYSCVP
jgi:hypothetical protein